MVIRTAALLALTVVLPHAASAQGLDPLAERLRNPTFGGTYFGGSIAFGRLDASSLSDGLLGAIEAEVDRPLDIERSGLEGAGDGVGYGLHLGRVAQRGRGVLGIELAASNAPGEPGGAATIATPLTGEEVEIATRTEIDSIMRLVARGGAVRGRTLIYGLLGPAYARGEIDGLVTQGGDEISRTGGSFDDLGAALGIGVERLVDPNFSVGIQITSHRFDNLGESEVDLNQSSIDLFLSARF